MAHHQNLQPEEFFVIRTPRLPVSELSRLPKDPREQQIFIEEWLKEPGVAEAIYIASPSLMARLDQWRAKPTGKQGRKITESLVKYFIRMTTRSTPFGLFAGIQLGNVSDQTRLTIDPGRVGRRHTRLDMYYLAGVRDGLSKDEESKYSVPYRPNPTLHQVHDALHYIEPYRGNGGRQYRLSSAAAEPHLLALLGKARAGLSQSDLIDAFRAEYPEAERHEVDEFINELINESLLLPHIPLPLTGNSPDQAFLQSLDRLSEQATAGPIRKAIKQLNKIDQEFGVEPLRYQAVKETLEALPHEVSENKLFQVDLYRELKDCQLDRDLASKVATVMTLLAQLGQEPTNELEEFVNRFKARFEGQMIPLSQVLNEEVGIPVSTEGGYQSQLLAGVQLPKKGRNTVSSATTSPLQAEIMRRLSLPENHGMDAIHIPLKALKKMAEKRKGNEPARLPVSFAASLSLYRKRQSGQAIAHLKGGYGPSAANLLGRFCHLDERLTQRVREHLEKEEAHSPDAIFAEVVHMPDGRPGNVIARPILRPYEIAFLGDSGVPEEKQIGIDDLYVFVEDGIVKLWSKRHHRQVVPRLSSAHNYSSRSLGIYKFLCMLQNQSGKVPGFTLPESLRQSSFVPRILLGDVIVSEKRWLIPRHEIEALLDGGNLNQSKLDRLKAQYSLNLRVSFARADNILVLDLNNVKLLEILLSETKGLDYVQLQEFLPGVYASHVEELGNQSTRQYSNEIILPVFNPAGPVETTRTNYNEEELQKSARRRFAPGSHWMSLKLYGAKTSIENTLVSVIGPFLNEAKAEGWFEKWFFIRYGDPDWHIRLRFFGDPTLLYGKLLPSLERRLSDHIQAGLVHHLELFTYDRETERYGGSDAINVAESLFMHDSKFVLNALSIVHKYGEEARWRLALMGADTLMGCFHYDLDRKFALVDRLRTSFGQEFEETKALRTQLGDRYRKFRETIDSDFNALVGAVFAKSELHQACRQFSHQLEDAVREYKKLDVDRKLVCSIDAVLSSLLHMLFNRLFKSDGRAQELVCYDLLRRHYLAEKAKDRMKATAETRRA
ncbi:thiopeptide-type bacteriocin biosynthesis protein [Natronospira proteinivora]|uniref:Thiopeptide-type bacteriocin biosynthesis protein n=1 Tax=Natronospira proteinivora TaxID=1807133 RepID=A0ABT1GA70_9GAMM|nr:lantibiotic dehydratase [Natronospira proteinivora]MCP1728219.1 thiopeptide-type bacteriocin biosynthesis protein [Natronospira proteinivora]